MSLNKKLNILLTMVFFAYGLLFAILLLGYFFPGNPTPNQAPWFVWTAIGEVIAFMIAGFITCFIVRKRDRKLKEQLE